MATALGAGELAVERLEPNALRPLGAADRASTLLLLYGLLTESLGDHTGSNRLATHPRLAEIRWSLEQSWLRELESIRVPAVGIRDVDGVVSAIRAVAAQDRLPTVYRWVAEDADLDGLRWFLATEGGPDGGFDDLVALCQVGLRGGPKLELARNYWDEMGRGAPDDVHTTLHERLRAELDLATVVVGELSAAALERAAFGGLLATNHWLQPEMLGALGLIELQAGPRSRLVLQGLQRLGIGAVPTEFYEVHADVDPVHGRDWVDNAIRPLVAAHPRWGARIVRGAAWRCELNTRFFAELTKTAAALERARIADPVECEAVTR